MPKEWNEILDDINIIRTEFLRLHNCLRVTANRPVRSETFDANLDGLIWQYNDFVGIIGKVYANLTNDHKKEANALHVFFWDKTLRLFSTLKIRIKIPARIRVIDPLDLDTDTESDYEDSEMVQTADEFLALAGRLIVKGYTGDPLGLRAFVNSLKLLKTRAGEAHKALLVEFVMTKLEGKALEQVREEVTEIDEIIKGLREGIKPESSDIIASKMLALRLNRSAIPEFTKQAEELAEAMSRALIAEQIPREKANEVTIKKTIELCRANARWSSR